MLSCTVHVDARELVCNATENAVGLIGLSSTMLRKIQPLSIVTAEYLSSLATCRMRFITLEVIMSH